MSASDLILNRARAQSDVEQHFQDVLGLLDEMGEYGANLIPRCFDDSSKNVEDIVVLGVMLKQFVGMLESVRTLVSGGLVFQASLPLRAMLEASLYAEWILKTDSHTRANAYYVANFRAERSRSQKHLAGDFDSLYEGRISQEEIEAMRSHSQSVLDEVNKLLSQSELSPVDKEFDKVKKNRSYDPNWYEIVGAKSVRGIAIDLDRLTEYDWIYSPTSELAHASVYRTHIRFKSDSTISFKPVRILEGITPLLNSTTSAALKTYPMILEHYRPAEVVNFARKYVEEWQGRFRSIKSVKVVLDD